MSLNVIDAANTVSFHLNDLINDDTEAKMILDELEKLLKNDSIDMNIKSQIRDVLKRNKKLSQWVHEFLNPLDISKTGQHIYHNIPGKGTVINGMIKYVCPEEDSSCNYWFSSKAGQTIPKCRKHGIKLVPEQQKGEK